MESRKNKRVLIVDDDCQFLEATKVMLEENGYDVVTARDGHEGLVQAERESPDLIVLDIMMPRRSGFGVLDRLCRRGPAKNPRIVVVTANEEQRHQEIAHVKGADAFLRKPFDMAELLTAVNGLLQV